MTSFSFGWKKLEMKYLLHSRKYGIFCPSFVYLFNFCLVNYLTKRSMPSWYLFLPIFNIYIFLFTKKNKTIIGIDINYNQFQHGLGKNTICKWIDFYNCCGNAIAWRSRNIHACIQTVILLCSIFCSTFLTIKIKMEKVSFLEIF